MTKLFTRIIVFLLIPCLLVEPRLGLGAEFSPVRTRIPGLSHIFSVEAVNVPLANFLQAVGHSKIRESIWLRKYAGAKRGETSKRDSTIDEIFRHIVWQATFRWTPAFNVWRQYAGIPSRWSQWASYLDLPVLLGTGYALLQFNDYLDNFDIDLQTPALILTAIIGLVFSLLRPRSESYRFATAARDYLLDKTGFALRAMNDPSLWGRWRAMQELFTSDEADDTTDLKPEDWTPNQRRLLSEIGRRAEGRTIPIRALLPHLDELLNGDGRVTITEIQDRFKVEEAIAASIAGGINAARAEREAQETPQWGVVPSTPAARRRLASVTSIFLHLAALACIATLGQWAINLAHERYVEELQQPPLQLTIITAKPSADFHWPREFTHTSKPEQSAPALTPPAASSMVAFETRAGAAARALEGALNTDSDFTRNLWIEGDAKEFSIASAIERMADFHLKGSNAAKLAPDYEKYRGKLSASTKDLLTRYSAALLDPRVSIQEVRALLAQLHGTKEWRHALAFWYDVNTEGQDLGRSEQMGMGKHIHTMAEIILHENAFAALRAAQPQMTADLMIIEQFYSGQRPPQDPSFLAALKRLPGSLQKIQPEIESTYASFRKAQENHLAREWGTKLQDVRVDDLISWFASRGAKVDLSDEKDELMQKVELIAAQHVVASLPDDRARGVTFKLASGVNYSFPVSSANRTEYDPINDAVQLNLRGYLQTFGRVDKTMDRIYSAIYHELTHRWQMRGMQPEGWHQFRHISWDDHPGPFGLDDYRKSVHVDRDFILSEGHFGGWEFWYPGQELAETSEYLYRDQDHTISRAIDNLIRHNDPHFAQKVFFANVFYGHVLSPYHWIVRDDDAPVDQEEGRYVFKENGHIVRVTVERGTFGTFSTEFENLGRYDPNAALTRLAQKLKRDPALGPIENRGTVHHLANKTGRAA